MPAADEEAVTWLADALPCEVVVNLMTRDGVGCRCADGGEFFADADEPGGEVADDLVVVLIVCLETKAVTTCGEVLRMNLYARLTQRCSIGRTVDGGNCTVVVSPAEVSGRCVGGHLRLIAVELDKSA